VASKPAAECSTFYKANIWYKKSIILQHLHDLHWNCKSIWSYAWGYLSLLVSVQTRSQVLYFENLDWRLPVAGHLLQCLSYCHIIYGICFESVSNTTSLKLNLFCYQLCMKVSARGSSMNETSSFCQMMAETDPFSKTWVLKETQNDGMCLKCPAFYCNTLS